MKQSFFFFLKHAVIQQTLYAQILFKLYMFKPWRRGVVVITAT